MRVVIALEEVPVVQRAMSSAYMDNSTPLQGFGIAFIMIMKRRGLRTLPCGVPFSTTTGSERADPTLTWILLSWRKLWIHSSGLPLTPILESCSMIPSLQTTSKAFSKSRKTPRVICFLVAPLALPLAYIFSFKYQRLPCDWKIVWLFILLKSLA